MSVRHPSHNTIGITLNLIISSRSADPDAAGIERLLGLEHIKSENLYIRSWGDVAASLFSETALSQ
jgi:hypothetical protein